MNRVSRRRVVQGAGAVGLGLLAGCGQWPGQAGQPRKVPRIGYLTGNSSGAPSALASVEAFREGLQALGYMEGQNIAIEWRFAEGMYDRVPDLVAELIRLPVDMIVATGPPIISAARQATSTLPIVMAVGDDPVGLGFVDSLARPGGNVTGVATLNTELSGKRVQLLKEVSPEAVHVAVLWDSADPSHAPQVRAAEGAARVLDIQLHPLEVREANNLQSVFAAATRQRADALIALHNPFLLAHGAQIFEFAAKSRLPAMYGFRSWVEAGGLMSYSSSFDGAFRRAAYYVDRILKGAKPAELPVEQPREFEFVMNLKTAQALGLTIPQSVLLQATEVIQ